MNHQLELADHKAVRPKKITIRSEDPAIGYHEMQLEHLRLSMKRSGGFKQAP